MRTNYKIRNKKGFTLVEMVLAMGLLTILSVLFAYVMIFALRMSANASARTSDSHQAAGAIDGHYVEVVTGTPTPGALKIEIDTAEGTVEILGESVSETQGVQEYSAFMRNYD
jgi:prepilin-type N-terminal cleavage/methylation domain-containing protein